MNLTSEHLFRFQRLGIDQDQKWQDRILTEMPDDEFRLAKND